MTRHHQLYWRPVQPGDYYAWWAEEYEYAECYVLEGVPDWDANVHTMDPDCLAAREGNLWGYAIQKQTGSRSGAGGSTTTFENARKTIGILLAERGVIRPGQISVVAAPPPPLQLELFA